MGPLRLKCSNCGNVFDCPAQPVCTKCGAPVEIGNEGAIRIYRMGSPVGIAVGYGIYIDEQPFGHLANKSDVTIPLPFGHHSLKMTCGMTRRCELFHFDLSPQKPQVFAKGRIVMGFISNKIVITECSLADMPS